MSGGGYFRAARRVFEHEMFDGKPYCEGYAWLWLVAEAVWQDGPELKRGQLSISQRSMAHQFAWTGKKVRCFLAALEARKMVEIRGALKGAKKGACAAVLTICNYDKYQTTEAQRGALKGAKKGAVVKALKEANEESKERKKVKRANARYAFEGGVLRLSQKHFDDWSKAFGNLDLLAELTARDAWLGSPKATDADRSNWFISTSAHFRNLNQRARQQFKQQGQTNGQTSRPSGITAVINRKLAELEGSGSTESPRYPVFENLTRLLPDR